MTDSDCDPNDWPLVAWVFIWMARGGRVSIVEAVLAPAGNPCYDAG